MEEWATILELSHFGLHYGVRTKPPARRTLRVSMGWAFLRQLT